jgi:hypothetical protein
MTRRKNHEHRGSRKREESKGRAKDEQQHPKRKERWKDEIYEARRRHGKGKRKGRGKGKGEGRKAKLLLGLHDHTGRRKGDVEVLCGVTVEGLLKQLLVQEVSDETDGSTEDEETVEGTGLEVLGSFLPGEGAGAVEQVAEGGGDATVNVEDEGVLLGGGDGLDAEGVVHGGAEEGDRREGQLEELRRGESRGGEETYCEGKVSRTKSLSSSTRRSGLVFDLTLCPIPGTERDDDHGERQHLDRIERRRQEKSAQTY